MPVLTVGCLLSAILILACMHVSLALAKTPFESSLHLIASGQITEARRALKSELGENGRADAMQRIVGLKKQ